MYYLEYDNILAELLKMCEDWDWYIKRIFKINLQ